MRVSVLLFALLWMLPVFAADEESSAPAIEYVAMDPKFTLNLAGRKKYLMIDVQLQVEGEQNIEKIKKHMPALRHALIMLFSGRNAEDLATMDQREALRKETAAAIRETLDKYGNSDGFRDVFFSDFLLN
ncbi:MAG: flagellar basal body-associated FliL family protein [Methylococcales bacterium]|nr:flagellar basal body-associated FliL family protein [Methylococcales bacterium]